QKNLENFLRAAGLDREFFEDGGETGNGEPGALEFLFDEILGAWFVGGKGDFAARALHEITGDANNFGADKIVEGRLKNFWARVFHAAAKLPLGDAGEQRVCAMKFLDGGFHGGGQVCECFRGSDGERLIGDDSQLLCGIEILYGFAHFGFGPAGAGDYFVERKPARGNRCKRHKNFVAIAALQGFDKLGDGCVAAAVARRARVENGAAADRYHWRELAKDEAVAGEQQRRFVETKLRERGFARRKFVAEKEGNFGDALGCALMEMH